MKKKPPLPIQPLPLIQAARYLRVPARWLREEVEEGRLPGLRAGRAILVHVPTLAQLFYWLSGPRSWREWSMSIPLFNSIGYPLDEIDPNDPAQPHDVKTGKLLKNQKD